MLFQIQYCFCLLYNTTTLPLSSILLSSLLLLFYYYYFLNQLSTNSTTVTHCSHCTDKKLMIDVKNWAKSFCLCASVQEQWMAICHQTALDLYQFNALFFWCIILLRKPELQEQATLISDDSHRISRFLFAENFRRKEGRHPNQDIVLQVYNWKQRWPCLFLIMEWVEYTNNIMLQNEICFSLSHS